MVARSLLCCTADLVEAFQEAKTIGIPMEKVAQAARIGSITADADLANEVVHRWLPGCFLQQP